MHKFSKAQWDRITERNKVYELDEVIHFGKFRECSLREIIESHPDYVRYLMHECAKTISNEALDYLERFER